MEAFFLSIATLFALLVLATVICVMLRFGPTQRAVTFYQGSEHLAQPRHHFSGGTLVLGLVLLFCVTLLLAIINR